MTDANPARARKSHIYAREEGDHYVEPLWLGEALFRRLLLPAGTVVLDPACGWGRMLRGAAKQGLIALGSDIAPRWAESPDGPLPQGAISFHQADWFDPNFNENTPGCGWRKPDVIVSNPPFDRIEEFLELALERAANMVALVVPARFLWGEERAERLLQKTPFSQFMPLIPRPSMPPGRAILAGQKVSGDTKDYGIGVWRKDFVGPPQIAWLSRRHANEEAECRRWPAASGLENAGQAEE